MNFTQAKDYLQELTENKGSVLGLENMKRIMSALSNPQDDLKFIHIAGTNGKGSNVAYISECLIASGYKTGIYTSPVVFEYLEKIRVGHRNISQNDFADCISNVKNKAEEQNIEITAFEAETAAAFLYFKKKECDVVVLETGLGGIDDATNIVNTTILSVITSISYDHIGILGKSLSDIALKKCGIIKNGVSVATAIQDESVIEIIKATAEANNSKLYLSNGLETSKYKLSMAGEYQKINSSLAFVAINALKDLGFDIKDNTIKQTFETTVIPGRFEIICKKPLMIIDGAHNVAAAIELRKTLINKYPDKKKLFIIGVFADKDYEGILENTVDLAECVVTLQTPGSARALNAYDLAKEVSVFNKNVSTADSIEEALEIAKLLNPGMIVAFGSLSYLGQLKKIVKGR